MKTTTKSGDTRSQILSLMTQHTAAHPKPAAPIDNRDTLPMVARAAISSVSAAPSNPMRPGDRYTVRLLPAEIEKVNEITLEAHQCLGQRITVSDVLRIALTRVSSTAPITSEELAGLRAQDRRRQVKNTAKGML